MAGLDVSIHAPVKARHFRKAFALQRYAVSIHAPVKARLSVDSTEQRGRRFQSTRP